MKTTKPTDFAKRLTEFLGHYLTLECGYSKRTVVSYSYTFTLLLRYMRDEMLIKPDKVALSHITKDVIIKFLRWLETERNCSVSTRNGRLAAIKSFFKFLQYRNVEGLAKWQEILSIKVKKAPEPETFHLSTDGMKLLLSQPNQQTRRGRRDLALLGFLYDSGCRVQELIDCTPANIVYDGVNTIVRIFGKGDKVRYVPLSENTERILKDYMDEHGLHKVENRNRPLFSNPKREKLTRVAVLKTVKKYAGMARLKNPTLIPVKITCHSFRRSKAMHMLEYETDYVVIKDILGHESIATTALYAKANDKIKAKAMAKVDPTIVVEGLTSWQKDDELLSFLIDLQEE